MTDNAPNALSSMNAVPWQNLKHAYGPATDVPELLIALARPEQELRNEAWHDLYGNLWHQGTIYEATVHAVPFFIRLLDIDSVREKYKILIYLTYLFRGRSYWEVHKGTGMLEGEDSKINLDLKLRTEMEWVEATRAAIRAGLETYVRQLQGTAVASKIAAAYLLGVIGDRADDGERDVSIPEEVAKSCEG